MNAPFILAQATVGSAASSTQRVVKIAKPQGEQAISLRLDNTARLDLTDIGTEKVTFVHVGDRLVILFDNQSTVTIAGFFDDNGKPLQNLNIEVEGGRVIGGTEFATLFPITDDTSILAAAGSNAGAPNSGANFRDATVDGFEARNALGLLSGEDGNGAGGGLVEGLTNTVPRIGTIALGNADEEGLFEGNINGPGDAPGEATSITISLNVDFGQDLTGRTLAFAATQPGLAGLTSGGEAISLALTVIGGLPALVGYTGLNPADPASHVFTVTLDTAPVNGEYTFTLLKPLDHPTAGTEDTITLSVGFVATDGNGDSANGVFQVAVNDDSPTADTVVVGAVTEDFGGPAAIVNASLEISWGADNFDNDGQPIDRSVAFKNPALAGANVAVTGSDGFAGPLTSNGQLVQYTFVGDVLVGYVGAVVPPALGASVVFAVEISDKGLNGEYSFMLLQPLDHPAPDGDQHFIDLTFSFVATDSDGDPVGGSFKIEIDANGAISADGASIDYSTLTEGVFINLANVTQIGPSVVFPGFEFVAGNTATDRAGNALPVVGIDRLGSLIVNATGGHGDDVIIGGNEANILRGLDGDDDMRGWGGNDTLEGGKGDDLLLGDSGDDTLRGGQGWDLLDGGLGNDTLYGGRGSDQMYGGFGNDTMYGGRGHDLMNGGFGNDTMHGGRGDDDLYGGFGDDILNGGRGSDILYGDSGADIMDGGRGNDFLDGGRGDDVMLGGRGDDLMFGGRDDDDLLGGDGEDRLAGEEGNDNLFGDADRDELAYVFAPGMFYWGHDVFVGGETGDDYDTAILDGSFYWNDNLTITLTGFESFNADYTDIAGIEVIASEIERIYAIDDPLGGIDDHLLIEGFGNGSDHIILTSNPLQEGLVGETVIASVGYENVRIDGKGGADIIDASDYVYGGVDLRGGGGDDEIVGSDQADTIRGGNGDDDLRGGGGDDLFIYNAGDGQDTVRGGGGNDLQEIYGSSASETFNVNKVMLGGQQFVGVNITAGAVELADDGNFEVATRNVEDIYINTGAGADTVLITGSLGGTGLATSTITIVDGNGNSGDTVDARGLTSQHSIDFTGNGGNDSFFVSGAGGDDRFIGGSGIDTIDFSGVDHRVTVDLGNSSAQNTRDGMDTIEGVENVVGSNFNDRLTGSDGANVLKGLDGNDRIEGGLGADTIDGGAGTDTAVYDEASTVATFAFDGTNWTVTIGGVTDTLFGVERVEFGNGKTFLLVDHAGPNGGYQTIQSAVDAANPGDTVLVGADAYTESVTVTEGITIQGIGGVSVNGTTNNPAFKILGGAVGQNLVIDNIDVTGDGAAVIQIENTAIYDDITFKNGYVIGGDSHGLFLNNATGVSGLTIADAVFNGNATVATAAKGEGAITIFQYNGDVTLTNVTVQHPGIGAENGIQIRGTDVLAPMGDVTFTNVNVTGTYEKTGVAFYNYSDATGHLHFVGAGLNVNVDAGWHGLNIDNVGGTIDLSNPVPLTVVNTHAGIANDIAMQGLASGAGENFTADDSDDRLVGFGGNDTLNGLAGNDILTGGFGDDTILGGAGDDTILYAAGDGVDTIDGEEGSETVGDTLIVTTTANDDYIRISPDLDGDIGLDIDIDANSAVEVPADGIELDVTNVEEIVVNTGAGNDTVVVSGDLAGTGVATSTVALNLGEGNDTVLVKPTTGAPVNLEIDGGIGNDTVDASAGTVAGTTFVPHGPDFLVSTVNTSAQAGPQITALANGGFAVTWQSINNGSNYDIRGQVFAADGTPIDGSDFLVSTTNTGQQTLPQITALPNGGFAVTWRSDDNGSNYDIRGQVFAADGTPIDGSDFLVSTVNTGDQSGPQITALANGGFAVTWMSLDNGSNLDIRGRVFAADGTPTNGSDFLVSTANLNTQANPQITALANGGFAVTWQSINNGSNYDIRGQVFTADGTPIGGSDFLVSTANTNHQSDPRITALTNGGFAVTWESVDNGADSDIRGRVFAADGMPIDGSDFLVSTTNTSHQSDPRITALANGGFAVTWLSLDNGADYDIRGQVFAADGTPIDGSDFLISTNNANYQQEQQITALADGGFVVTWRSLDNGADFDIRGQVFAADGTPIGGSDFLVSTANANDQYAPQITALANGGFAVMWTSNDNGSNNDIRGRVFDALGNEVRVENAIHFDGGEGNDTFKSGAGDDVFEGGAGADTVDFSGVGHGIALDLGNTSAQNTGDGNDTFGGVENAVGSNFADTLTGNGDANVLTGLAGNDTIEGRGGNDYIDGGAGDDTITYNLGDGVDSINGNEGGETLGDKLIVNGDGNAQSFVLSATTFGFNVDTGGAVGAEIDTVNIESATVSMAGGSDALTVDGDLNGETITLGGTAASFTVASTGSDLPITTTVTGDEAITINGNGGNDTINASGLIVTAPSQAGTVSGPVLKSLGFLGDNAGGAIPDVNPVSYVAQSFVAKAGPLNALSFTLRESAGTDAVDFRVLLVAWDAGLNRPVPGAPLYESATLTKAADAAAQTYTVAPNLALVAGQNYAFILDAFVGKDGAPGVVRAAATITSSELGSASSNFAVGGDTRDIHFASTWTGADGWDLVYQLSYGPSMTVTLNGGAGNDTITGSTGNDTISGGADDDTINYAVGTGQDTVDGGTGTDKLNVTGTNSAETYNINAIAIGADAYVGINIENGANNNVQASAANYEVATKAVEDIFINTSGGADTVNVVGSLNGTGLLTSTMYINTGGDNDTIDLSGRTSGHRVVADGGTGDDTFISTVGNAADSINGGEGRDKLIVNGLDTMGETITLAGTLASFTVSRPTLAATTVTGTEAVTVNGNGGNDTIDASALLLPPTGAVTDGPGLTTNVGSGSLGESPLYNSSYGYVAQTFVATSNDPLNKLTFKLGSTSSDSLEWLQFRVRIYAWDDSGKHPTGPELYQSAAFNNPIDWVDQTYTVTPNLAMAAGQTYAFVLDAYSYRNGNDIYSYANFPIIPNSAEPGGLYLLKPTSNIMAPYETHQSAHDLAYQTVFGGDTPAVTLDGGAGDDTITGSISNDNIFGGADQDTINYAVGTGQDTVDGGSGTDKLNVTGTNNAETYNINLITLNGAAHVGINILAGANNNVQATAANYEVATKAVEDIFITTNGGGDTVNVVGSLNGTGLNTATMYINTGDGDDTIDLTGRTSGHRVVADGGADTDLVKLAFAYGDLPLSAYQKIFGADGTTLIGVSIKHTVGGVEVTDEFRNVENFEFTGGTKALADLFGVPPVINSATFAIAEGGGIFLLPNFVNVTDLDSSSFTYTVSGITHGSFQLTSGGGGLTEVTSFTSANLIDGEVLFFHDGGEAPPTFNITASDGTASSATIAGTVSFTNVNDAPTGTSATITVTEDVAHVFALSDFGYDDAEGDSINAVSVSLPLGGAGRLLFDNQLLSSSGPYFFAAADIAAGRLVFQPGENVHSMNAAIQFTVADQHGLYSAAKTLTMMIGGDMPDFGSAGDTSYFASLDVDFVSILDLSGNDKLQIVSAIGTVFTDLNFERVGGTLEVSWTPLAGESSHLTILSQFSNTGNSIEYLRLDGVYAGYVANDLLYTLLQPLPGVDSDVVAGSAASESLSGGNSNDLLFGNGGHDVLDGGTGRDLLSGGLGNDTLIGGAGKDTLIGGASADTFKFAESDFANSDVITDYSAGEADKLNLSSLLDAAFGENGNNDVSKFVKLTYDGTNTKVEVDTDGALSGQTWTEVATLNNYNSVTNQVLVEFENAVHALNAA